ncbi:hypothetical protein VTI28DRAFT_3659 [Corynascus sepedonium]
MQGLAVGLVVGVFRQHKELYTSVTGRYMDRNDSKEVQKWQDAVFVARYGLQAPCARGKDVANSDTLLVLQIFSIKFDTSIFPWEMHRIQPSGFYLGLAFMGTLLAEFLDGKRKTTSSGVWRSLSANRPSRVP